MEPEDPMSLKLQREGLRIALDYYESIKEPGFKERLAVRALRETLDASENPAITRDAALAYVMSVAAELDRALGDPGDEA
jgi:hypothetical protein